MHHIFIKLMFANLHNIHQQAKTSKLYILAHLYNLRLYAIENRSEATLDFASSQLQKLGGRQGQLTSNKRLQTNMILKSLIKIS